MKPANFYRPAAIYRWSLYVMRSKLPDEGNRRLRASSSGWATSPFPTPSTPLLSSTTARQSPLTRSSNGHSQRDMCPRATPSWPIARGSGLTVASLSMTSTEFRRRDGFTQKSLMRTEKYSCRSASRWTAAGPCKRWEVWPGTSGPVPTMFFC